MPVLKRAIELMGPVFSIQYGCTEVGGICAMPRMEVQPDGTPDDVGVWRRSVIRCSEIEFRLVDDQGEDCPPGTPGEVVVRSTTQLDGYWNNTAASLDALRDGWYYTGRYRHAGRSRATCSSSTARRT